MKPKAYGIRLVLISILFQSFMVNSSEILGKIKTKKDVNSTVDPEPLSGLSHQHL